MQRIKSLECSVCFETVAVDPVIHVGCGNTFGRQCAIDLVNRHGKCPLCRGEVTMDQFKPNVALRDGIREIQDRAADFVRGSVKALTPVPEPNFAPSLKKTHPKTFKKVMEELKGKDLNLYMGHIDKGSTKKLRVDWGNGYVAVYKSGNWHFYKIGNGRAPEICKRERFDEGVKVIFPG